MVHKTAIWISLVALALPACDGETLDELRGRRDGPIPRSVVPVEVPLSETVDCGQVDCSGMLSVPGIGSRETFDLLSSDSHKLGAMGRSVKFFIDFRDPRAPRVYYMNGNFMEDGAIPQYAKLHFQFARHALHIPEPAAEYNQVTYFDNDKRYFAGAVQLYGVQGEEVFGVQFFPQDVIAEQTVVDALVLIKGSFRVPEAKMAFVSTGLQQTTKTVGPQISGLGFDLLSVDAILGSLTYLPMHIGEAYGYLRLFPESQDDLGPKDIPVFEELPLDLTVVGGVITKAYQDINSHVNLKSKERGTPNMVLRDASRSHPELARFADKPVHLVVGLAGWEITASTASIVEAKHKERMARPWVALSPSTETRLLPFDSACPGRPVDCLVQAPSFGGKAMGLAFLAHPAVVGRVGQLGSFSDAFGYDLSPHGLAVPVTYYEAFVNHPENGALRKEIQELISREKAFDLTPAERRSRSQRIAELFLSGSFPEGVLEAMHAQLTETLPGIRAVKVRSSANAEDIPGFNGAGLYDSFKAVLAKVGKRPCYFKFVTNKWGAVRKKVRPKTLECAVKGVYASLWNVRAIDERTYARIDHGSARMGLAIVPTYDHDYEIKANSVVVTRVLGTDTLAGYGLSVQHKNNLVTNPAPPTYAEDGVALFFGGDAPTSLTVKRYARPFADEPAFDHPVLAPEENQVMVEISKKVEMAYCLARPEYYTVDGQPGRCDMVTYDVDKPTALDMEFKLLENGHFILKQVREFAGGR